MSFSMAYATKRKNQKCMAKGGEVHAGHSGDQKGVHRTPDWQPEKGKSYAGTAIRSGKSGDDSHKQMQREEAMDAHHEVLAEMKSMPKPKLPMAEGGEIEDAMMGEESDSNMLDMVGRILHKRMYSKGGQVANDVGVSEADELPAEYDDLVLDDHLEDNSGAGNEMGGDIIDRILKRKKA